MIAFRYTKFLTQVSDRLVIPFLTLHQNLSFSMNLRKAEKNRFNLHQELYHSATSTASSHNGTKISRLSRLEAEKALFDYLHCTRSIGYTDAEYVSKNSPIFIDNILSKFEKEENVGRSFAKFLRYHPINEFEPFFESLGMKQPDLYSMLPRNLIFLSDDDKFLENYRALCNYGVPRSKIGQMYKDGMEMFRYEFGVLSQKLHSYEKLGLSKPTIIKLVTCCPTLLVGDINDDFLNVLQIIKSFGVELDWIRGSLSGKSKYDWHRILQMLHLLVGIGCNKNDLSMFIREHPRFIFDGSGKNIYILIVVLLKLGLKRSDLLVFFKQNQHVLTGKSAKNIWRSVQFLSKIEMGAKEISSILSKHARVLGSSYCLQPEYVLKNLDITPEKLCEVIIKYPSKFSALTSRKMADTCLPKIEVTSLNQKTNFLLRIGFVENSDEMTKALTKFGGRGDQLQERFDLLVNVGLNYHTVAEMIRTVPSIFNQSSDLIKKKIDYLLNDMGYPLEALVVFPTFLCYNLEKIKLRFLMYRWLRENGVVIPTKNRKMVRSTIALSTLLACSDAKFVRCFVGLHPEGAEVWENLKSLLALT